MIPFVREYRLSAFISNTIKAHHISAQEFWQLREFYSPGLGVLNKEGVKTSDYSINYPFQLNNVGNPFFVYSSKHIQSSEYMVDASLNPLKILNDKAWKTMFKTNNEYIFSNKNTTLIIFIKPVAEMKQANGFIAYGDQDKEFVKNKEWLVVSILKK